MRIRDFVDRDTLVSVYNALIRPHFDYCSEVWDTLGNGLYNRLQKLQNRAARVVLGVSNDIPGSEALVMLGWEPLETRRAKTKAMLMYKVLNGLAPSSLADLFVRKSDITEYDLRSSHIPHCNCLILKLKNSRKVFLILELSFGIFCQQICVIPIRLRTLKLEYALSSSDLVSYIML